MGARLLAIAISCIAVALWLAWYVYPISLPSEAFEVRGMDATEIRALKEQLSAADISKDSGTHGSLAGPGLFSLDCGGLPVASVWDLDYSTQIIIVGGAEDRFPSARPVFAALRETVSKHAGQKVQNADFTLTALDKFVLKYRDGEDPEVRCTPD